MADSFTNRGLVLQVTGSNVGTWGTDLNTNDITITDAILGSTQALTLSSGTLAISSSQSQNLAFRLTGTLTTNVILTLPFNLATGATTAVGGQFIFDNETSGAYTVTVKTVASGSTGVTVPQGLRATLYSDTTNVWYANDGGSSSANRVNTYAGSPDGVVTCTPGSATTPADMLWDRTNNVLYVCSAAPNTWEPSVPSSVTVIPTPVSGVLTLSSDANQPILTNDATAATSVYYTPYTGSILGIPNGSTFSTYTFSQLTLALSATYQISSGIYDVFGFVNSGNAAVGFGPIWTTGGGSVTAGSCARGTGAGSTQLNRLLGTLVNTVSMTLNNGATTYSISAQCATYLGSVFIDATAGQVSCHRTWGQSRKWGVWNAYNRLPIVLKAGDATASWDYTTATYRAANGDTANSVSAFCGLAEETISADFRQYCVTASTGAGTPATMICGVGWNSTTSPSSVSPVAINASNVGSDIWGVCYSKYIVPPSLGINVATALEKGNGYYGTFYGTEPNMVLSAEWQG